jgi:gas vesicle protein
MSENDNGGGTLLALMLGAALGAAAGLLLAPRAGKETRKRVKKWLDDAEEKGQDIFGEGQKIYERGKDIVQEKAEKLRRAMDKG